MFELNPFIGLGVIIQKKWSIFTLFKSLHNSEKNIDRDPFFYPKFIFITLKHYTKVIFWYQLSNYNFSIFYTIPKYPARNGDTAKYHLSIRAGHFGIV